ncbi:MAG: hypothetical protein KatS3mg118_2809 [Paracoccaceae bacterium]|nr:MAG: hypothetical protein KatS3mg118_2809 [Paracoccaceae bacterium]
MTQIILFAPLIGALVAGFGHRLTGERFAHLATTGAAVPGLPSVMGGRSSALGEHPETIPILRWIDSGSLVADWALRLDTADRGDADRRDHGLGAGASLFAGGYMDHDPNWKPGESYKPRFFAYLSLFTFAMLMLVTADNLAQLFFGWEGVGLASYLLIGFYWSTGPPRMPRRSRPSWSTASATSASALGIFALFFMVDSIQFSTVFGKLPELAGQTMTLPVVGASGAGGDRGPAVHRGDGQVGAVHPAHLAARRDGGPDAGLGADPCRDHGDRGGVPGVRACRRSTNLRRWRWAWS